jgi:hypothetical protein
MELVGRPETRLPRTAEAVRPGTDGGSTVIDLTLAARAAVFTDRGVGFLVVVAGFARAAETGGDPVSGVSAAATPAACGPARDSPNANAMAPMRAPVITADISSPPRFRESTPRRL